MDRDQIVPSNLAYDGNFVIQSEYPHIKVIKSCDRFLIKGNIFMTFHTPLI